MARPQAWGPKRRGWRKIHLGIDEQTLEVRAVEITGNPIGDAPVLPDLLSQIPADEQIGSVTADGAYDTRKCHDAIADRGAHAVIPPGLRQFRAELIHRINSGPPFTPAGTPSPGNPQQQAQSRATRRFARRNTSVAPSGNPSRQHPADAPAGQWMDRIPPPKPRRDETSRDISFGNTLPVSGCTE